MKDLTPYTTFDLTPFNFALPGLYVAKAIEKCDLYVQGHNHLSTVAPCMFIDGHLHPIPLGQQ